MTSRAVPFVLTMSALFAPAIARADEPEPNGPAPIYSDFSKKLRDTQESLAAGDCAAACKALGSLREAADTICKIEPGARCDRARLRAEEMTKRVRESCPNCAIAFVPEQDKKAPANELPQPGPPSDTPKTATGQEERSPPAEKSRGGCASCDVTGADSGVDPSSWIALVSWLLLRHKRRRQKRA